MVGVEGVEPPFSGPKPEVFAVILHPETVVPPQRIERCSLVLQTSVITIPTQEAKLVDMPRFKLGLTGCKPVVLSLTLHAHKWGDRRESNAQED